ncbi:MAG: hypothetical protein QXS91_01460 [Candidatus Anstonellales archaeon]
MVSFGSNQKENNQTKTKTQILGKIISELENLQSPNIRIRALEKLKEVIEELKSKINNGTLDEKTLVDKLKEKFGNFDERRIKTLIGKIIGFVTGQNSAQDLVNEINSGIVVLQAALALKENEQTKNSQTQIQTVASFAYIEYLLKNTSAAHVSFAAVIDGFFKAQTFQDFNGKLSLNNNDVAKRIFDALSYAFATKEERKEPKFNGIRTNIENWKKENAVSLEFLDNYFKFILVTISASNEAARPFRRAAAEEAKKDGTQKLATELHQSLVYLKREGYLSDDEYVRATQEIANITGFYSLGAQFLAQEGFYKEARELLLLGEYVNKLDQSFLNVKELIDELIDEINKLVDAKTEEEKKKREEIIEAVTNEINGAGELAKMIVAEMKKLNFEEDEGEEFRRKIEEELKEIIKKLDERIKEVEEKTNELKDGSIKGKLNLAIEKALENIENIRKEHIGDRRLV